jgi:type IVB pilus formation R64 PilN family outer membrane protein
MHTPNVLPAGIASWAIRAAGLPAAIALAACAFPNIQERLAADRAEHTAAAATVQAGGPTLAEQAGAMVRGGQAETDLRAKEQASSVVLRRSSRAWIGGTSVPMGAGEQLPSVFAESVKLNFEDRPNLRTMAERLTALAGVPVRIKADAMTDVSHAGVRITPVRGAPAAAGMSGPAPIAERETSVDAVPMRWSGSLKGYLDHVTDLTGLSWEYRDDVVMIERLRTEFFAVAAFDGEASFSMGMTGADAGTSSSAVAAGTSGSSSSTSTASSDVGEKGKFNPIDSMINTIKQIVKDVPGSEVIRAEGSGRIAVTTSREAMAKVRDFMRTENEALKRSVQIQFDIYSVRRSESDERGVDWALAMQSISRALAMTINSPATLASASVGTVNLSILNSTQAPGNGTAEKFGNSSAIVQLLSEFGASTEHRPVSLVSKHRQWDRTASLDSVAYVSETIPGVATSIGAGAPGLKTSVLTTGDRYFAQAQVMDNGDILLKFSIGLSSLVQMTNFTSGAGSTQQTVQTPETSSVIKQDEVLLKAGQVLAITGLSRIVSEDKRRTLTEEAPIGLGGSRTVTREREDFVIFVRPTIL